MYNVWAKYNGLDSLNLSIKKMLVLYSSIDIKYLYAIARQTTGDILHWEVTINKCFLTLIYGFTQAKILDVFFPIIFLLFVTDYLCRLFITSERSEQISY